MMDESERLARQLMAEEQAAFYERLEREQAAAIERMRADDIAAGGTVGADLEFALRIAAADPDAEVEAEDDVDPEDMTYDQLLELGERLETLPRSAGVLKAAKPFAHFPLLSIWLEARRVRKTPNASYVSTILRTARS